MPRKKATVAPRTNWLLLVAACLAVTAIAYWQYSSTVATPNSSAPRTLTIAAPAAAVATPAAPTGVAAPARVKDNASARTTKAPATRTPATKARATAPPSKTAPSVGRHDPPAATTVERENPLPAPAPAAPKSRAETYEAAARISLQKRDYDQAREHIDAALGHGGKAAFTVIHDHSRGNFETDDPKATCVGELTIVANEVRFEPREGGDRFSANWSDVRDAGGNKFFGSGRGGFHVSINAGGKYKNFNLAPESKEKAEAKVILDLLNSYIRGADRTR